MASPSRRSAITASLAGLATLGATAAVATPAQATGQGHGSNRPSGKATVFTVISDIQGDLGDFELALKDIESTNPESQSAGLVVNGDITPRGYDFEYDAVRKVLDANPTPATSTGPSVTTSSTFPSTPTPAPSPRQRGPTAPRKPRSSRASTGSPAATGCIRRSTSTASRD